MPFFSFTEILCGLTVRGFQSSVTTAQHASVYHQCQLRAAACNFCVRDEATVEWMLKFQPLISDFDPCNVMVYIQWKCEIHEKYSKIEQHKARLATVAQHVCGVELSYSCKINVIFQILASNRENQM